MVKPAFAFKQFEVMHHQSTMKVGTDAVLLGSWVAATDPKKILDIGTGCGVIALMMAQKYKNAQVLGIDIDQKSVEEAQLNFATSVWSKNMEARNVRLQELAEKQNHKYDLIVSNPPYFRYENHTDNAPRLHARQQTSLGFEELMACSAALLEKDGILGIIMPFGAKETVVEMAKNNFLYPKTVCDIYPNAHKNANLCMVAFGFFETNFEPARLYIRGSDGGYTAEYKQLTRAFYKIF